MAYCTVVKCPQVGDVHNGRTVSITSTVLISLIFIIVFNDNYAFSQTFGIIQATVVSRIAERLTE